MPLFQTLHLSLDIENEYVSNNKIAFRVSGFNKIHYFPYMLK